MNAFLNIAKFFKVHGGVHPPENKAQSTALPIAKPALPDMITLPLRQHVGNIPKVLATVGDKVLKGQLIAEAEGAISSAIHAPTSGEVVNIEEAVIPHPSGLRDLCIFIKPDGLDTWAPHAGQDWKNTPRQTLIDSLRLSGIVGLGGATFPTQIKLKTNGKTPLQTVVINAAECEPYITCDDMLMQERAAEIVQGIEITQHLLEAKEIIIGIEDNKPLAIAAMQQAIAGKSIALKVVPTIYPSGDARRLVHLLTEQEIPYNKRSTEVGIQVFNVGTVYAIHRFFDFGEPLISRIVSITGNVQHPQNFEALLGTPVNHLLQMAGGKKTNTSHLIMGGPMMGFNLPDESVSITKAANCIIAASPTLFAPPPQPMPCIRCARCADACPVSLQPQELYWFAKSDNFEKARDYKLFDCIECGACSYVCPSNIPLVQYYRYAKSEIIADDKAKEAANIARLRNEARLARIEREKQERAQKHAERAQASKKEVASASKESNSNAPDADAKKAAIAAALARAKAQKEEAAQQGNGPKNTSPSNVSTQQEIEAIDARRQQVGLDKTAPKDDAEKQARIAEAIAKAKAAKLANTVSKNTINAIKTPDLSAKNFELPIDSVAEAEKKAKIAAAIEKAKAAKAAALAQKEAEAKTSED
jgi:Na+-translocating ferredoxin:NAD+ oxidoreductase subunit C